MMKSSIRPDVGTAAAPLTPPSPDRYKSLIQHHFPHSIDDGAPASDLSTGNIFPVAESAGETGLRKVASRPSR